MKEQKHQNWHQNFKFCFMIVFKVEADTANIPTRLLSHSVEQAYKF